MSPARLPPELLRMVFAHLRPSDVQWALCGQKAYETRSSLSVCTLVSRSWHLFAREILFHDVVYSFQCAPLTDEDIAAWPEELRIGRWCRGDNRPSWWTSSESLPLKSLGMLVNFLQQMPDIRSSIRRLKLACFPEVNADTYATHYRYDHREHDAVDPAVLILLVKSLPRLEHLQLCNIFVPRVTHSASDSLISVRRVEIIYDEYFPSSSITTCTLLSYFAKVDVLSVSKPTYGSIGMSRDVDKPTPDFPARFPLDVQDLTLSRVFNDPALHVSSDLLLRSPSAKSLRRLTLDSMMFDSLFGMEVMLRDLGSGLEYFKLTFMWGGRDDGDFSTLNLSNLSAIREVTLGLTLRMDQDALTRRYHLQDCMRYFGTIRLSQATNPHLQKIQFSLVLAYREGLVVETLPTPRWWEDLGGIMLLLIREFESRLLEFVHAFRMEGLWLQGRDVLYSAYEQDESEKEDSADAEFRLNTPVVREALLHMFPRLVQDGLVIYEDGSSIA